MGTCGHVICHCSATYYLLLKSSVKRRCNFSALKVESLHNTARYISDLIPTNMEHFISEKYFFEQQNGFKNEC